ncbi:MAG: 1-phosphofructokinase [Clostridiales bacterium]|nr:1-phosphofructokinase [Clostridiales bacterium]MCD7873283.1 1-phosphofructokinase [Clostridiales bacterium]
MIYTVTFNPALDYVMKVEKLRFDDINRTCGEELHYGGKGINVSVILSRLGIENRALGFKAGFTGIKLQQMLEQDGIKTDFIDLKNGSTRINVKIKAETELDINAAGPPVSKEDIDKLFNQIDCVRSGDTIILAGSVPGALPSDIYEKILEKTSAKGVYAVVDSTGELLLNVLKFHPFLIKPNNFELGDLFGVKIETEDEIVEYAKKLQEMGAVNVLVSRGKDGAILIDEKGKKYSVGIIPGKPLNSVGCGDSMVAGFVAGYMEKQDYSYALRLGAACSNATAFCYSLAEKSGIMNAFEKLEVIGQN